MKELKNIDDLFKEGLGEAENHIAFNESDWDKLERKLDKKKKRIPVLWISVAGGIAAVLALVFTWMQLSEFSETSKPENTKAKPSSASKGFVDNQGNTEQTIVSVDTNKTVKEKAIVKTEVTKQYDYSLAPVHADSLNKTSSPSTLTFLTPVSHDQVGVTNSFTKPLVDTNKLSGVALVSANKEIKEEQRKNSDFGKFTFSVGAAPAFNGVNNLSNADLGGDLGVGITFGLSKKWSVSTGAIYAKKVYSTDYSNYNPVNPPPVSYHPSSVDADCRVLDIPLNVNYTVFNNKKNAFKVSTGLSSYLMLREDYNFNYSYSNPSYPKNYEVVNQNKHWLSVINASVEYQHKLNSNLSLGVQPFVKIPIDGVGYSRVKLKTAGVAVKLNFELGKKKE